MFDTLLIANRGEIACRVAATARRMGIRTVAVYSDADAHAAHVDACDMAIHIGEPEPRHSYLRGDVILQAAKQAGAQAIHPGYGFLSENADFAQDCAHAGIVFVGPPASAISAMGSKSAAKALMENAGVPLVPGYHGDNQDPDFLRQQADAIGYPVMIKASAGGGGKGMRIVERSDAFLDALASCQREAASSFGDDRVLIERYLQKPRHIEIQIFADTQGHTVYLFERDCSVQRRHQKVIEEAPAPGMTPERRAAMGEAAVAAAKAVNYVGAGTVEFITDEQGRFYFMEMNTRLQVEHPVTELITGLDLVEWQLRVAAGEPLPLAQDDLRYSGHAIEARIYAENPDKGFLPSIGRLQRFQLPDHQAYTLGAVRVDRGVRAGDTITPYYDPMIAKLIVHGQSRDHARLRMIAALSQTQVTGVQTNIGFLRRLMQDEAFARADLDTGLIARRHEQLLPPPEPAPPPILALACAAVMAARGLASSDIAHPTRADPWDQTDGWRIAGHYQHTLTLQDGDALRVCTLRREDTQWFFGEPSEPFQWHADPDGSAAWDIRIRLGGADARATVAMDGESMHVFAEGRTVHLAQHDPVEHALDDAAEPGGSLTAPMPGKIIAVNVQDGETVSAGDTLMVMEAMKMEHSIQAPRAGTIKQVRYMVGDQVPDGATLIELDAAD